MRERSIVRVRVRVRMRERLIARVTIRSCSNLFNTARFETDGVPTSVKYKANIILEFRSMPGRHRK